MLLKLLHFVYPMRYLAFTLCVLGFVVSLWAWGDGGHLAPVLVLGYLAGTGVHDLLQTKRSILRNYPVIGHMRFIRLLKYLPPCPRRQPQKRSSLIPCHYH